MHTPFSDSLYIRRNTNVNNTPQARYGPQQTTFKLQKSMLANLGSDVVHFGRSTASQVLNLSNTQVDSLKPALEAQQKLIQAMGGIPYSNELYILNSKGVAKTKEISATEALGHLVNGKEIAVGDLHASSLKLLETLVSGGMISMPADKLEKMTAILNGLECKTYPESELHKLEEAHAELKKLIPEIQWTGGDRKLILIGDVLADRGPYDPITLDMIEHLEKKNAHIVRLASNHDHEVLGYFSPNVEALISPKNTNSIRNAVAVAKKNGPAAEEKLKKQYLHYMKQTQPMYYDAENKVMYMHAPLNKIWLQACIDELSAGGYNIPSFSKWNRSNLSQCVERLGKAYQTYAEQQMEGGSKSGLLPNGSPQPDFFVSPFYQMVWYRTDYPNKDLLPFTPEQHGVEHFVHGHDAKSKKSTSHFDNDQDQAEKSHLKVYNLDNYIRKGEEIVGASPMFTVQAF